MMQLGLWPVRKRLKIAVIAFVLTSIIVFTARSNIQYQSSETVASLPRLFFNNKVSNGQETVGIETPLQILAPLYVKSILDPEDEEFDRLRCPTPNSKRYDYLRGRGGRVKRVKGQLKYFFALNLRQCVGILPRLMGSILETVRFLGPENCALSIVEGASDDGTLEILEALRAEMGHLGIEYHLQRSEIDSKDGDRIEALATLRNLALEPLFHNSTRYSLDTSVIFVNDIALCMEDMLELIHQRVFQKADMTCAMDWNDIDPAPIFYDIWVARAINGDTFWEIPLDGGWRFSSNLFWNHPSSRQRYDEQKAFQVYTCWNGAVVFTAKPLMQNKIRFRRSKDGECFQGEPRLFCKDMWMEGYSRIAVVPSVNVAYSDKSGKKVKKLHQYVSEAVRSEGVDESWRIAWNSTPPEKVKCMADFNDHSWVPWNEGFEKKM